LVRSLHVEFDRALEAAAEERGRPLADIARELGDTIGAADRLDVLVEHLVRLRRARGLDEEIVRRPVNRLAVHDIEARRDRRTIHLAMAGPAADHLASAEVRGVDGVHHLNHLARRDLARRVDGVVGRMTLEAAHAQRGREQPHRAHELVDRNALEHLDVLERLVRRLRALSRAGQARLRRLGALACRLRVPRAAARRGHRRRAFQRRMIRRPGGRRGRADRHPVAAAGERDRHEPRDGGPGHNQPHSPRTRLHGVSSDLCVRYYMPMQNPAWLLLAASTLSAPPPPQSPAPAPAKPAVVGTMSDLMVKVIYPASDAIFYITTRLPTTDSEWVELQGKALMVAESANLLMMPG